MQIKLLIPNTIVQLSILEEKHFFPQLLTDIIKAAGEQGSRGAEGKGF